MCASVCLFFCVLLLQLWESVMGILGWLAIKHAKCPDPRLFCLKRVFQNISTMI